MESSINESVGMLAKFDANDADLKLMKRLLEDCKKPLERLVELSMLLELVNAKIEDSNTADWLLCRKIHIILQKLRIFLHGH